MKKTFILLSLIILTLSANAFAQKKKPAKPTTARMMTAKQFFLALPSDYIVGTPTERGRSLVFPSSITKDFLTFMISDETVPKAMAGDFKQPQGLGNMRIFRGKTSTIVGLRYQIGDGANENPTVDSVNITTYLLEYKGGKWTNITDSLLPQVSVDYAYKVLSEDFQMKDVKKDDVWVEFQINELHKGIMTAARIKGNESITTLKFFKWDGAKFVESEE